MSLNISVNCRGSDDFASDFATSIRNDIELGDRRAPSLESADQTSGGIPAPEISSDEFMQGGSGLRAGGGSGRPSRGTGRRSSVEGDAGPQRQGGASTAAKADAARIVASEWRAGGMSETGVAGVLGEVQAESGFDPMLRHPDQPRFGGEAHFAHGLYQEGGGEWNNYARWLKENHPGADWRDPRLQSQFSVINLKANYPRVWERMQKARSAAEAGYEYRRGYLKPAARYMNRGSSANWWGRHMPEDHERAQELKSKPATSDRGAAPDDYDYAAARAAGVKQDKRGHWPDTYKLPNHITFSDESKYSDKEHQGGHWKHIEGDQWEFTPGSENLKHHSIQELQDYFKKYEPDSTLILPKPESANPSPMRVAFGYDPNLDEYFGGELGVGQNRPHMEADPSIIKKPKVTPDIIERAPESIPKHPLQQVPEDQLLPGRPNFYKRKLEASISGPPVHLASNDVLISPKSNMGPEPLLDPSPTEEIEEWRDELQRQQGHPVDTPIIPGDKMPDPMMWPPRDIRGT